MILWFYEGSMKTTTMPGGTKLQPSLQRCSSPSFSPLLHRPARTQARSPAARVPCESCWLAQGAGTPQRIALAGGHHAQPPRAKAGPWKWVIGAGQHPLLLRRTPGPKAERHAEKPAVETRPFITSHRLAIFNSKEIPHLAKPGTIVTLSTHRRKRSFETLITSTAAFLGYSMIKKPQEKAALWLFLGHSRVCPKNLVFFHFAIDLDAEESALVP